MKPFEKSEQKESYKGTYSLYCIIERDILDKIVYVGYCKTNYISNPLNYLNRIKKGRMDTDKYDKLWYGFKKGVDYSKIECYSFEDLYKSHKLLSSQEWLSYRFTDEKQAKEAVKRAIQVFKCTVSEGGWNGIARSARSARSSSLHIVDHSLNIVQYDNTNDIPESCNKESIGRINRIIKKIKTNFQRYCNLMI